MYFPTVRWLLLGALVMTKHEGDLLHFFAPSGTLRSKKFRSGGRCWEKENADRLVAAKKK